MKRRNSAVALIAACVAVSAAVGLQVPPPSAGTPVTGGPSTSAPVGQAALEPFQEVEWTFLKKPVKSKLFASAVLRQHIVKVVEIRPRGQHVKVGKRERRELLRAIQSLEATLPGATFKVKRTKPIDAPASACTSEEVAWAAAERRVPQRWVASQPGRHVAALVNCKIEPDWAIARGGPGVGSGWIWSAWEAEPISHELGHTLGLWGHSGALGCDVNRIHPTRCKFIEYSDPVDVMGNQPLGPMSDMYAPVVSGVWRDLVYGAREVPLNRSSSFRLDIANQGTKSLPLRIKSKLGSIYIDAGPAFEDSWPGVPGGVYVRLAIKNMKKGRPPAPSQATLQPSVIGGKPAHPYLPVYVEGDSFAVPGTNLIATVDSVASKRVTISFAVG